MNPSSISELLAQNGDREFLVTEEGSYTYAEIHELSRRFATLLRKHGVQQKDHIAILAGNHASFIVSWFGAALAGAIAATLNNQLLAEGLRYTISQSDSRLIVGDREWIESSYHDLNEEQKLLPLIKIESEASFFEMLLDYEPGEETMLPMTEPLAILYTSGTTGLPKGVMNSQIAYWRSGWQAAKLLELTPEDRLMVFLPMFHVNPQMMGTMSCMCAGATMLLRPKFSASKFFEDAERLGATGCTYVGTILSILVNRYKDEQKNHGIRFCFGAGAPTGVWRTVEERFGIQVLEVYGMTELGGWTSSNSRNESRFGSCGKVREDIELKVQDEDGVEVPVGVNGEIVGRPIEPYSILSGYWNKPDKMVESCNNLWFHSGDRGHFDEDGFLYYQGRIKELIRRGGEMFSPIELEASLIHMNGVLDCAFVGVPDPIMDEEIKAVVVANSEITPQMIVDFLKGQFPKYMMPRYIELVREIPKTANEKIQRERLKSVEFPVVDLGK
ncbi:class I adenylate-forming enzyme family protein [Roseovarius sp. MMSF_3281]|uniref:class I adenylate-forming enzyme family protein n=1 Tax=Roseovarius sp. MMSF_3281 TaxID=3046694 RepID=UPI00273D1B43|nr:AMP-binding protein [Roseovarius sp. MMSF_3281]